LIARNERFDREKEVEMIQKKEKLDEEVEEFS